DEIEQGLGGIRVSADGNHGIAELVGEFDDAFELGAVLFGAEAHLVRFKTDGEGKNGTVIERAAAAEGLDLVAHGLRPEPLAAFLAYLGEITGECGGLVVEAGREQGEALARVASAGGEVERVAVERFK